MDPTTLFKCSSCMGHFLVTQKADDCHGTGYVEVYFCTGCSIRYMNYRDAVECCDPDNINTTSQSSYPPSQPSV